MNEHIIQYQRPPYNLYFNQRYQIYEQAYFNLQLLLLKTSIFRKQFLHIEQKYKMAFQQRCLNATSASNQFYDSMERSSNQFQTKSRVNKYKSQASNFLKTSVSSIIKNQMKAYHIQQKLQKEMAQYKKNTEKKQFMGQRHKVEKFRSQQTQKFRSKFEKFVKEKQKKQQRIQQIAKMKRQQALIKKFNNQKKFQQVRKRHLQKQQQQISTRLSRVNSVSSVHSTNKFSSSKCSFNPRKIISSQNHRDVIRQRLNHSEEQKITRYIKKIRVADSRIIQKQLKNEQRKEKSIKSEVKNLTKERDQKQENLMNSRQQKYISKMQSFSQSLQRNQLQNSSVKMNKSFLKTKFRQKVMRRKQQNDSIIGNKTVDNFMRKTHQKENFNETYQKRLDLLRSKSSFMNNTIQIEKEEMQRQKQKAMKILYSKIQKIKQMSPNQVLPKEQKQNLINLLDPQDPNYAQILEFLSCTKGQFLKKKIQREEERLKIEKTKKSTRFNKN